MNNLIKEWLKKNVSDGKYIGEDLSKFRFQYKPGDIIDDSNIDSIYRSWEFCMANKQRYGETT